MGEDSLRQMFVKSRAFRQNASGLNVKWVRGMVGPRCHESPVTHKETNEEMLVAVPQLHLLGQQACISLCANVLTDVEKKCHDIKHSFGKNVQMKLFYLAIWGHYE